MSRLAVISLAVRRLAVLRSVSIWSELAIATSRRVLIVTMTMMMTNARTPQSRSAGHSVWC